MLAVMGTIFYLSHIPGDNLEYQMPLHADKIAHGLAYALLATASLHALTPLAKKIGLAGVALIAVLICVIYGVGDEFHQSFVPGRSPSHADVLADFAGGLLAAGFWYWNAKKDLS